MPSNENPQSHQSWSSPNPFREVAGDRLEKEFGLSSADHGSTYSPTLAATQAKRFHGTVALDAARVGQGAGAIAEEIISHLFGLVGERVTVILEVEAEIPSGAPEHAVRTVIENARTLKFTSQGFENEWSRRFKR